MGHLVPQARLWNGIAALQRVLCVPTAAPKMDFLNQYEHGTRARREGSDFCYCVILLMNHRERSLGSVETHG